jgi:hypothetical protein
MSLRFLALAAFLACPAATSAGEAPAQPEPMPADFGHSVRICGRLTTSEGKLFLTTRLNGGESTVLLTPFQMPAMAGPFGEYNWQVSDEQAKLVNTVQILRQPVLACAYSDRLPSGSPAQFRAQQIKLIAPR